MGSPWGCHTNIVICTLLTRVCAALCLLNPKAHTYAHIHVKTRGASEWARRKKVWMKLICFSLQFYLLFLHFKYYAIRTQAPQKVPRFDRRAWPIHTDSAGRVYLRAVPSKKSHRGVQAKYMLKWLDFLWDCSPQPAWCVYIFMVDFEYLIMIWGQVDLLKICWKSYGFRIS